MAVPIVYRKSSENIIASYSFTDIIEKTGVVDFYGFSENLSGSTLLALGKTSLYSADIQSSGTSWTFNTGIFNLPAIVKGTATIRFSAALTSGGAGNTMNFDVAIQKVSEGVVTAIGNASTATKTSAGAGTTAINYTIPISCAQTHFKIGDNLRIVFTGHTTGTINLGHDPANRSTAEMTATDNPTRMECFIPFKIDS